MTTLEFNHKLISLEDNIERFALSLTYNREKAKDLLQETYLKALYYKDKYIEVANFNAHIGRPFSELACKEINGAINSLEDELRVPFIMHTKGFKYKEIAENLNLNIGTVKSRIFLTRKKLMELLNDYQ